MPDRKGFLITVWINVCVTLLLLILAGLCYRVEIDTVKARVNVLEYRCK